MHLAFGIGLPLLHAMAARVSVRVDVDRNAKQMIRDFSATDGVLRAKTSYRLWLVSRRASGTDLANPLFDAMQGRHDLFVYRHREAKEPNGAGERSGRLGVDSFLAHTRNMAVFLDPVLYGPPMQAPVEHSVLDVARSHQEALRCLGTANRGGRDDARRQDKQRRHRRRQ